jgi:competence protein ComEC
MRRPALVIALGLAVGIGLGSLGRGISLAVFLPLNFCTLFFCVFKSKFKKYLLVLTACVLSGFLLFNVNLQAYHAEDLCNSRVEVVGTVTDAQNVLRDCFVDGKKVDGKIEISVPYEVKNNAALTVGSKIKFTCKLGDAIVDKDGINTLQYKKDIRYYPTEILSRVELIENTSPTVGESIRLYVKDMLYTYLDDTNAGIAYAMLVGDKSSVADDETTIFRNAGIAHVFAVSGLHVGFLVMAVSLIFGKRKKLCFAVTMLTVFFYAYLCDFSPSIIRAMLMTGILLFVRALGREPDFLSSVSVAAAVIMLIKPFYLFDAGFQMSVGAMLGICFITKPLDRLVRKKHSIVKKAVSALGISLGATLGTAVWQIQYFGSVSVIGILFNVIAIPVISLVFTVMLCCLIIPPLFWLFSAINWLFNAIIFVASYFAQVPLLVMPPLGFGIVLFYLLLYAVSGHFLLSLKKQTPLIIASVLMIVCTVFYTSLPDYSDRIDFYETDGVTFCVTASVGERFIFTDLSTWQDYLTVKSLAEEETTLYIVDYEKLNLSLALRLSDETNLKLKVLSKIVNDGKYYTLRGKNIEIERIRNENGAIEVAVTEHIDKTVAITVVLKDMTFTYIPTLTEYQLDLVFDNLPQSDAYFCESDFLQVKERYGDSLVFSSVYQNYDDIYSTAFIGNFTLRIFSDKMLFVE